mmetsp:Transcript_19623/g.63737  ORF Transcript_19623/g.63737 Transcript_19623/m.63737 type:complete len:361 (-) Transcript_19623:302-1384(-)
MMGPVSAAGRISSPSLVMAGASSQPTRSYERRLRSARRAKCRSLAERMPVAMSAASDGSMRERSSERLRPRVSSTARAVRTTPCGAFGCSTCLGARLSGPRPPPRPRQRTRSRSSRIASSFFRSASSTSHPRCSHMPLLRSNPSGPSARSVKSSPSNIRSALSSLSTAGSHCCFSSSTNRSASSFFCCSMRSAISRARASAGDEVLISNEASSSCSSKSPASPACPDAPELPSCGSPFPDPSPGRASPSFSVSSPSASPAAGDCSSAPSCGSGSGSCSSSRACFSASYAYKTSRMLRISTSRTGGYRRQKRPRSRSRKTPTKASLNSASSGHSTVASGSKPTCSESRQPRTPAAPCIRPS